MEPVSPLTRKRDRITGKYKSNHSSHRQRLSGRNDSHKPHAARHSHHITATGPTVSLYEDPSPPDLYVSYKLGVLKLRHTTYSQIYQVNFVLPLELLSLLTTRFNNKTVYINVPHHNRNHFVTWIWKALPPLQIIIRMFCIHFLSSWMKIVLLVTWMTLVEMLVNVWN